MESNVLLFLTVPALGLVATQWAVINWSKVQFAREGITDQNYTYRCSFSLKSLIIALAGCCSYATQTPCGMTHKFLRLFFS
jgi:hypothetical protein